MYPAIRLNWLASQMISLMRMHYQQGHPIKELARVYKVHPSIVSNICHGRTHRLVVPADPSSGISLYNLARQMGDTQNQHSRRDSINVARLLTYSPNRFRRELGHLPSAVLSADEEQRYLLTRRTRGGIALLVNFIMLNPSTADAECDDQTIRRCKRFAQSWGFEYMAVTNLWSYRTPNTAVLFDAIPLSPKVDARNLAVVELVARAADQTVVAYGDKGGQEQRDERILDILNRVKVKTNALGVTGKGYPRHPLFRPAATRPTAYRKRGRQRR